MLTVSDTRPNEVGKVVPDDYLPLVLEFPAGAGGTGTAVTTNGDGSTLVEIGVDLSSGRVVRASLVGATPEVHPLDVSIQALPTEHGLPLFDVGVFPKGIYTPRIDWRTSVKVETDGALTYVRLTEGVPTRRLTAGEAEFLLAGNCLVGFGGRTSRT